MTLRAVSSEPDADSRPMGIPTFEGKPVHGTILVIKGVNKLECDDRVLAIDSICNLRVEARTTNVRFEVDESNGKLWRVQVVKAIEVEFQPFEEGVDDGVLR